MPELTTIPTSLVPAPLPTMLHDPAPAPICIHLLAAIPDAIIVDRAAVGRLNFQPRVMRGPQPIIAARRGSTLMLSVHLIGPLGMRHPSRGRHCADQRVRLHWNFQLTEMGDPLRLMAVRRACGEVANA